MNIDHVKKEFPIFDEKIQNNDLVYLDSANSSQKPRVVINRINDFYTKQFYTKQFYTKPFCVKVFCVKLFCVKIILVP